MMKIKINIIKSGFTLSECLIAITLIGIIAAITIAGLIQKSQKSEYIAGLKKAYSVINQAMYRIADNNGYPVGDYSFFEDENFIDEFGKVTNAVKKCDTMAKCDFDMNRNYKRLDNKEQIISDGKTLIMADGQLITFAASGGIYGVSDEDAANSLGRIIVDVNGAKKPNKIGLDTFFFVVVDGKGVIPFGNKAITDCSRLNGKGYTCTAKALREGVINY